MWWRACLATRLLAALLCVTPSPYTAAEEDEHAAHRLMQQAGRYERSEQVYLIPEVRLVDVNGTAVGLAELLDSDEPLLLTFIFTSCNTICPVMTATLAMAQPELERTRSPPRLVSITIDPGYDTPARLKQYGERFHAGANWHFLTGTEADVVRVQRAFGAYFGTKLNHVPLTFLRAVNGERWVRLEGLVSARDLVGEYRALTDSR